MWRVVLASSLLLTLLLGAVARASPPQVVIESATLHTQDSVTTLRFTARFAKDFDPQYLPQHGTAVVMQFDGQRSKCQTVALARTSIDDGVGTYVGRLTFTYKDATAISGRVDLAGSIWDFTVPLDGSAGTFNKASYQGSITGPQAQPIRPPAVVITPDPTANPQAVATAAPASRDTLGGLGQNPVLALGLIVVIVAIATAFIDRKRSLDRVASAS